MFHYIFGPCLIGFLYLYDIIFTKYDKVHCNVHCTSYRHNNYTLLFTSLNTSSSPHPLIKTKILVKQKNWQPRLSWSLQESAVCVSSQDPSCNYSIEGENYPGQGGGEGGTVAQNGATWGHSRVSWIWESLGVLKNFQVFLNSKNKSTMEARRMSSKTSKRLSKRQKI